jgi:filamentous hemagglutinin
LILNEVVSANRSQLDGYIEVSGEKADVIVANPNGITLNGAGFINTDRVTLTTGEPSIDGSGNLDKFIVERGDIRVDGDTNLLEQNQVDLLSRTLKVNQTLHTNRLTIRTGANEVAYDTLTATPIAGEGAAPNLSVDVAALGGMYAGAISLEATEVGVGVNMQGELMSEGDLTLDVNGELKLIGTTQAEERIHANAKSMELGNDIAANTAVTLEAENTITLQSTTNLQSETISVTSTGEQIDMQGGTITATDSATLQAATTLTQEGTIHATTEIELTGGDALQIGGLVESDRVSAESTHSSVTLTGSTKAVTALDITAADQVTIDNAGSIVVDGDTEIRAENRLTMNGEIDSDSLLLKSNTDAITLGGDISTDTTLTIEAATELSATHANLNSDDTAHLSAASVALSGSDLVTTNSVQIEATGGDISIDGSDIQSQEADLALKSSAAITVTGESSLSAATTLDVISDTLTLTDSSLSSGDKITIDNDGVKLTALTVETDATIISESGDVEIEAEAVTNTDSQIIAGANMIIGTDRLTNSGGLLFAIDDLTIDNGADNRATTILNHEGDMVAYNGSVTLKADSVTNEGSAPTYIADGYVATWYETASGSSDEIFEDTYKLLKDDVKLPSTQPKPEYYQAYIDLLTSLMRAEEPSVQSKALIKESLLNPDGTIQAGMIGTWNQLSGKATEEGITDFDAT